MTTIQNMTDCELIEVVRAMDRAILPLERRFEGDDTAITELMDNLGVRHTLAEKLIVTGAVLRECVARGISIQQSN